MEAGHIATKGDLLQLEQRLAALLAAHVPAAVAAPAAHEWLTINQVAAELKHTRKTVLSWISSGKEGRKCGNVRLFAHEFQPGNKRIPRAALIAYAEGLPFDSRTLSIPATPKAAPQMRAA